MYSVLFHVIIIICDRSGSPVLDFQAEVSFLWSGVLKAVSLFFVLSLMFLFINPRVGLLFALLITQAMWKSQDRPEEANGCINPQESCT